MRIARTCKHLKFWIRRPCPSARSSPGSHVNPSQRIACVQENIFIGASTRVDCSIQSLLTPRFRLGSRSSFPRNLVSRTDGDRREFALTQSSFASSRTRQLPHKASPESSAGRVVKLFVHAGKMLMLSQSSSIFDPDRLRRR